MIILPSNVSAPASFTINFKSPALSLDLTLVSGVSLNVLRRDGTSATWAMTINSVTPGELVASYTFVGSEITTAGLYYLAPILAVPGGSMPAQPVALFVTAPFASAPVVETDSWLMATSNIAANPQSVKWRTITGAQTASPFSPFMAVDLRITTAAVTLWAANDGDIVVLSDVYGHGGTNVMTLVGSVGQLVPGSNLVYGTTGAWNTFGFVARLKYSAVASSWFPW